MKSKNTALLFCALLFISIKLNAKVLYEDHQQGNLDYSSIPIQELQSEALNGDKKAEYLLALHKVRDKKQKEEGVLMLEKLAASDFLDVKHSLYKVSRWAKVVSLTPEKALAYLKEAAEGGYAVSQVELAKAYNNGNFGTKDPVLGHFWFQKAAEQGDADGLSYTSNDYYVGRGVPKDYSKGFEWLIKSYTILGRKFEEWEILGQVYEEGLGTPTDLVRAYMCYDMEGTAGIEKKERIAPRMTAEQRAEGLRLSREWQEKNHVYTMQSLGLKRQKDGSYQ